MKQRLDDVRENHDFGFESVMGYLELGGKRYLMGATQNPVTYDISSVEVRELFEGDTFEGIVLGEMSAQEFAGELAKIGSTPIMEDTGSGGLMSVCVFMCMRMCLARFAGGAMTP